MKTGHIALIGAGAWGQNIARTLQAAGMLGAIVEPAPRRAAELQAAYPEVPLYAHPEALWGHSHIVAVVIATPATQHAPLCRLALDHGRDVMVEKPLCLDPDEAAALVELSGRRGRILMVGHLLCYHPAMERLDAALGANVWGPLRHLSCERHSFGKVRSPEDVLYSMGTHALSVWVHLLRHTPKAGPFAVVAQRLCLTHPERADAVQVWLQAPDLSASLRLSWLSSIARRSWELVTASHLIGFDEVAGALQVHSYRATPPASPGAPEGVWSLERGPVQTLEFAATAPLELELRAFANAVDTRQAARTDGVHALQVAQLLDAATRSMRAGGAPQTLPGGVLH